MVRLFGDCWKSHGTKLTGKYHRKCTKENRQLSTSRLSSASSSKTVRFAYLFVPIKLFLTNCIIIFIVGKSQGMAPSFNWGVQKGHYTARCQDVGKSV